MRIVHWNEMQRLTSEERSKVRQVECGPDCPYCGESNHGIAVSAQLDHFGDVYPEATNVVRDVSGDWVVYGHEPGTTLRQKELGRYPDIAVIRNMPATSRLYAHWVTDEEPGDE
jgi:hypothetical protein